MPEEPFLPIRSTDGGIAPVTSVRTTLLTASLQALRARDLADGYFAALPREHHDVVNGLVAGTWVPLALAEAHYGALDTIGISPALALEIGSEVTTRIQRSSLSTLVRLAHATGVTPWVGLANLQRLMDRIFIGGAVGVYKLGPKEARIEIKGVSLVRYSYFRNAWRGMFQSSALLFCQTAYLRQLPSSTTTFILKMSWV